MLARALMYLMIDRKCVFYVHLQYRSTLLQAQTTMVKLQRMILLNMCEGRLVRPAQRSSLTMSSILYGSPQFWAEPPLYLTENSHPRIADTEILGFSHSFRPEIYHVPALTD